MGFFGFYCKLCYILETYGEVRGYIFVHVQLCLLETLELATDIFSKVFVFS